MEKRLHVRKKWRSKVVFEDEFGEGLIYLYSKDVSLGGLFLEDPPPLKLGAHLFLSLLLPGTKKPLRLTGQIVRFVEHNAGAPQKPRAGAGVRFVDIDGESLERLTAFVNG